jgi:hypothetical protein
MPKSLIVIEGTHRECEKLLLLGLVSTRRGPSSFEVGDQRRRFDGRKGCAHDSSGASQVALGRELPLALDDADVGGGKRAGPVQRLLRLGVAAQPGRVYGTARCWLSGVEGTRLGKMLERRVPTTEDCSAELPPRADRRCWVPA